MMAQARRIDSDDEMPPVLAVGAAMEAEASDLNGAAAQCDSLCLRVGAQLIEAVPSLTDLAARFTGLSETLGGADLAEACASLEAVGREVAGIGAQMARERQALKALIDLNAALSSLIENVADDIRFLSAMIPVVKVESVSIDDDAEDLQSFGRILEDLAAKARRTIDLYRSTHGTLLQQLDEARTIQASFESRSRSSLATITEGIAESLGTVAARRTSVSAKMTDVATCTQRIGMQIAEGVVALQIGDNIRQRIEHAHDAMSVLCSDDATRTDPDARLGIAMSDGERWFAALQLCRLSSLQVVEAGDEFRTGIETIVSLLSNVGEATAAIMTMSHDLFTAEGDSSRSFLDDLEARLKKAWMLIDEYGRSRTTIDAVTASVATTFGDLEGLGSNVAALVTDMTIIGTNAIIKSYRLGLRGAGLSVIAQHLRSHALKVAQGIKLMTPALGEVLVAARSFTRALDDNGAARMMALGAQTTRVLDVFKANGTLLNAAIAQLEVETASVDRTLKGALENLSNIGDIDGCLCASAARFDALAGRVEALAETSEPVDAALDRLLRPRYTMQSERRVHDDFFNLAPDRLVIEEPADIDALLF